jgi:hypothetical protein
LIPHQETPQVEAAIEIETISASKTRARSHSLYRAGKRSSSDFETSSRSASADPTKPCTPDFERYLMAHSSGIHANYGDWLVPDLKAAIECIPTPPVASDESDVPVSEAAG